MSRLPDNVRVLPKWLTKEERNHIDNHTPSDCWELGQQGSGYYKRDIKHHRPVRHVVARALHELGDPELYDAWLISYPTGSSIPVHRDELEDGTHHVRINAIVNRGSGGLLRISGVEVPTNECDAYIFRPDQLLHEVSAIETGTRLVFSVGADVTTEHAKRLGLA